MKHFSRRRRRRRGPAEAGGVLGVRRDPPVRRVLVVGAVVSTLIGLPLTTVRVGLEYRDHAGESGTYGGARKQLQPVFDLFDERVGTDDRWFLAVGPAPPNDATTVRVSLFANYLLLPAVRVDSPDEATVVLAYRAPLPRGVGAARVERRGDALAADVRRP